ncbi:hypothetical protein, variant 1 [Aphanomyces astaci]|uniref:Choline transporter-like protein n=1 Tax=Aphanomyces astaci TaxID=112090 RepID=W4H1W9_APHAT|nr:hypothetical protein, variant 1 [Aphanomyces astaci]ETV85254.1 hypothetical protein, variant 1 [Aphanomyces astaci]|eukprot:XP_009825272.1 hypothetical protein, variant 1 [Aphanomyces astaci]
MFSRAQRTSSGSMPGWMSSPTGETPPTSARGRKGGGRAHTSSFGDPSQPSWLNETTPRAAPSVTSWTATGEGDPLLPNKDTYVDIGLTRRHFKGPLGKRYSTDMLCFLLFGLYMVGMVALGIVAFVQDGLSDKAIYLTEGVDFQGHGCGSNGAVFYPHYQSHPDFGICVSECPNETSRVQVTLPVLASLSSNASNVIGATNMDAANATTSSTTVMRTVTFPGYATIKQGYVCAPVGALDAVVADTTQLNDVFGLYIGAIRENWEPLLYSAGTCLGLATLYLILLRFGGCFILGLSVVAFQAALVAAAVYIWSLSTNDTLDRHAQNILLIAAVFLVCGAMAYFLAVVVLVQRLLLAGKYLVFGTRVFSQMNKMVLIPFLYSFALVAALAWGLAVTVCLFTAGTTIDVPETIPVESTHAPVTVLVRSFERDSTLRWLFVYHAFGMYWLVSVLLALVDMTVAMAVAVWYFTPTDRQTKAKAFDVADPVQFSISTILKYHVGTAAFSALVVAPVRYIRNFFMYIDANKEVEAGGNWFSQLSSTLCCCCIWCFNQFIVFICKESYFVTAIEGTSFYSAARVAHGLITSHILRVGAINRIGNASVLLGKLIICSATSAIAWTMLVDKAALSDVVVPMTVIVLGSYAIAHTFMTLYETTINVLLLSFAMDESMNGGRNRAEFAQVDFTKSVNDNLRPKWQTVL